MKVEREAPEDLSIYPSAVQTRRSSAVKDDVAIETFILSLEEARGKVREILNRTPRSGHHKVVEGWRQLSDGKIEFTTRLWPTAD
jgi:hypothetical protein